MELKAYWLAVKAGWKIVVAVALVAVALAAVLFWPSTAQYSSSTKLFVSPQTGVADLSEYYARSAIAQQRLTSYVELASSQSVIDGVNDKLDFEITSGEVVAVVVPTTVIIEITATDADPARAQQVAAAMAEVLPEAIDDFDHVSDSSEPAARAAVIDAADLPTSPVPSPFLRNLVFALVLGLGVGAAIAVLRHVLRQDAPVGPA